MRDRLPPIPPDEQTDAQTHATREFAVMRGSELFGPFVPLLRSPQVMVRVAALGEQLRYRSSLPTRLVELVILLVAREWTQQFEWHVHEPLARQAGVADALIVAIADGRPAKEMTPEEQVMVTLCDELHRARVVSDATFVRAVALLGEQGLVDAVATVGYYTLLAMVVNAAQTALPDGVRPRLA